MWPEIKCMEILYLIYKYPEREKKKRNLKNKCFHYWYLDCNCSKGQKTLKTEYICCMVLAFQMENKLEVSPKEKREVIFPQRRQRKGSGCSPYCMYASVSVGIVSTRRAPDRCLCNDWCKYLGDDWQWLCLADVHLLHGQSSLVAPDVALI